jgi:outer membrane receptor for ferrienterochelin and colicins
MIKKHTFLIVGCFLSSTAFADQEADLFNLSLSELLQTKVTIASKNEETTRSSPSSVTIFTRKDIKNMGVSSWIELINQVPGFYSMMNSVEGNQSHLVIRGHAQTYANTLLVLLNGHRINDDYTGGINYVIRFMELADVERIEIIRGPGSAIYGSNAFSGVINILTEPTNNVSLSYGEFTTQKLQANYATTNNNWTIGAGVSYSRDHGEHFDGIYDPFNLQTFTHDARKTKQVRAYLSNDTTHIFAQYLDSEIDDYYLFRRLRDGVNHLKLDHLMFGLNHKFYDSDTFSLELSGGLQTAKRNSLGALDPQGEAPFENADFLFGVNFEYSSKNIALDSRYQVNQDVTLNSGLSITQSQVPRSFLRSNFDIYGDFSELTNVTLFDADEQRVVLDKKRKISSAYLQTQWQATPKLKLTAGIRHDGYNDINGALMPRFATIYDIDNRQTVKLLYGQAYKAPSLGDLYDDESGLASGQTIGSQTLKASEMETLELVYFRKFDAHQFIATYFDNHQINIISYQPDGQGNQFLANVASNDAKGIEIEYNWQANDKLRLNTSITHLLTNETYLGVETDLTKSEAIVPENLANFNLFYRHESLSFNLNGNWRSNVEALKDGHLWLFNANINKQINDDFDISFKVSNLLDEKYFTSSHTSLGLDVNGNEVMKFPARGRHALLQVSYTF